MMEVTYQVTYRVNTDTEEKADKIVRTWMGDMMPVIKQFKKVK
jgi:hypothetical protein